LLCTKYPSPVSQDEFLSEVWDGSYVTSQSIAQMIRSLRISLKDESKSIIVTIPKLGYQLTAEPTWEALESLPASLPSKPNGQTPAAGKIELDNISYSATPLSTTNPLPHNVDDGCILCAAAQAGGTKTGDKESVFFRHRYVKPHSGGGRYGGKGICPGSF
jgi:DNA-binding winged helix-turn-helix (wHTH) protein